MPLKQSAVPADQGETAERLQEPSPSHRRRSDRGRHFRSKSGRGPRRAPEKGRGKNAENSEKVSAALDRHSAGKRK